MHKTKKFLARFFSMKTSDLMRLCIKTSLFCVFSLYFFNFICDYFNRRLYDYTRQILVDVHDKINRKSQKNILEADYQETSFRTDCLKNQCMSNKMVTNILQEFAKQNQIEIHSYTASQPLYRESYTKTTINYKISGSLEHISTFLSLIEKNELPVSCNNLVLHHKENNIYELQLNIVERKNDTNKKPLQPEKQAEGLGGEQ